MFSEIILGLLTIAMSGVTAAVVTYKLRSDRDDRNFRQQKLEDVFLAFRGYTRQLGITWAGYVPVMTGKIDYNQALDLIIDGGKDRACHFDQLEMLMTLYWPALLPCFHRLKEVRDKANDVLAEHKRRYLAGHTTDKISFDAMKILVQQLDALEAEFSTAARGAAKSLRGKRSVS